MKKLKEKLRAKLSKNGGFTLIEMLIVVAIIAILIAVSIPMVGTALERARQATDAANERAAKAAMTICYLNDAKLSDGTTKIAYIANKTTEGNYYYNAKEGTIIAADTSMTGYGKCSTHPKGIIKVGVTKDGEVSIGWTVGTGLCGDIVQGD